VALTVPWRLLFHVTLISTIKSLEIKVARCQAQKNIGIAKIVVSTKYQWKLRWRVIKSLEIKVAHYQAQKKYRHRKNIGFDKILAGLPLTFKLCSTC
jgi:hypothetical protein